AAGFVDARALEVAGLDLERVEAAIVVAVEPFADRVAGPGRLFVLGEVAPVGVDAARLVVLGIDVADVGRDHEFERPHPGHHARHAGRDARDADVFALATGGLIGEARFEDRLILRRERRLLPAPRALGLVPLV